VLLSYIKLFFQEIIDYSGAILAFILFRLISPDLLFAFRECVRNDTQRLFLLSGTRVISHGSKCLALAIATYDQCGRRLEKSMDTVIDYQM